MSTLYRKSWLRISRLLLAFVFLDSFLSIQATTAAADVASRPLQLSPKLQSLTARSNESACSSPSWLPTPENWVKADVDNHLTQWWANISVDRGSATFVDLISRSFGDMTPGKQCGIGVDNCDPPDCAGFVREGGPQWVFFVRYSLNQIHIHLNNIWNSLDTAGSDLGVVVPDLADKFFTWKDPKAKVRDAAPWLEAGVVSLLSFTPFRFIDVLAPVRAFASAGLSLLQGEIQGIQDKLVTMKELGLQFQQMSYTTRDHLETWASQLFNGSADSSGKTIVDYMAKGRFNADYTQRISDMINFLFRLQISKLINSQWKQNSKDNSKHFIMCTNYSSDYAKIDGEFFWEEDGRACVLHVLKSDGEYDNNPKDIAYLKEPPYRITAKNITASSLRSYVAGGINYNESDIIQVIENTTLLPPEDQFFRKGVSSAGVWTLPVCDIGPGPNGTNQGWVVDSISGYLPCCCGANCSDTPAFMEAAGITGSKAKQKVICKCKMQYPSYPISEDPKPEGPWLTGFRKRLMGACILIIFVAMLIWLWCLHDLSRSEPSQREAGDSVGCSLLFMVVLIITVPILAYGLVHGNLGTTDPCSQGGGGGGDGSR